MMLTGEITDNLYSQAKSMLSDNLYDQDLEDSISRCMDDEDEERADLDAIIGEDFSQRQQDAMVDVLPSEFTEFSIRIPIEGTLQPFSFEGREYLRQIYDSDSRRILLKFARQSEKSTALGNKALAYSAVNMAFRVLYVTATAQQAQVFSVDRIKDPIELSPELNKLTDSKLNQNVFFKQFKNRSQIRIRYAFLTADRVRGIPSDMINIDEIQDIITENIPVIEQCASHSFWKIFCYSGTPKSMDNTIEVYWSQWSTQNEWVVPCERHGVPNRPDTWHWNILGVKNIGKSGLICSKCGGPISARHPKAQWASMQPVTDANSDRVTFEGYRIPQIMVPWADWTEILAARERYPTVQFNNEILGLSYDSGTRPLTRVQLESCCLQDIHINQVEENAKKCSGGVFAGIDWGTGEGSYTVLTLGGYLEHGFTIFFKHRFTGDDLEPRAQLDKIIRLLVSVNFTLIGTDYGGGFDRNDFLMRNFSRNRLFKFQYAAQLRKKIRWDVDLGRYLVHRTEVMSDVFNAIKRRQIFFPNYDEIAIPHVADMLNIFSEYNRQLRMVQYQVSPGKTDDTFHSVLYCLLASMLIIPRPDILIPLKPGDTDFGR